MMMFVYKNWNDIAKGCFRRFTWELKIGEDMAGNGPCRLGHWARAQSQERPRSCQVWRNRFTGYGRTGLGDMIVHYMGGKAAY
jgi:hypothetical protein